MPNAMPTLKLSTQKRYRRTLKNHLLPAFGERRLCDIGTLDLQRFVLQKMDSGLGWAATDHLRNLMSKIFATANKWQHFSGENPASGVELPEKKPVRQKRALSPQQARHLLLILRDPVRMMVHLALLTGLRVGEILGLRWQDVDFAAGGIRVEQAYYRGEMGSPKTKDSRRILPMPESLKAALMRFYRDSGQPPSEGLIFRTRAGNPFNDTNLLHRYLKPAGKAIRCAVVELALTAENSCHLVSSGRRFSAGGAGADGAHQTLHHAGNLHHPLARAAAGGSRETGRSFVDEC